MVTVTLLCTIMTYFCRYRDGAGNAYGGGVHDSSLKTNAAGNQGQYGNAGGYRGTDNRGVTLSNADLYRAGLVQGSGASGGVVGPIPLGAVPIGPVPAQPLSPVVSPPFPPVASPPLFVQAGAGVPLVARSLPVAPGPPYASLRATGPYVIPTPNKLYVDRPGMQNVLVAAV